MISGNFKNFHDFSIARNWDVKFSAFSGCVGTLYLSEESGGKEVAAKSMGDQPSS